MGWFSQKKPPTNRLGEFWKRSSSRTAENWELDAKFFTALSQWTLDHPDSTLEHILQRVSDAIDAGEDYINLIPDTPFPARSLVKSVAQLIRLSAKISQSQNEVRNFALKILQWVNRVRESFINAGDGRFTKITWDNLASMRTLIDDICNWAAERLEDARWSILDVKVGNEIRDFQSRLDEAEKLFTVRSLIVISGGLDTILVSLSAIFVRQYVLLRTLKHLHDTQEVHLRRILEEQERQRFIDENLQPYTVQDPTYIAQRKQPCDPDTRTEILGVIRAWIDDHSNTSSKNFLWLVGPPGCGKSAITASIAHECKSHNILGAQFFINRSNHNTTNPIFYFPTVSQALARRSDSVQQHLYHTLRGPTYSVETPQEAAKLFVDIVGKAASNDPHTPVVIIFDGLDETSRDRLKDTAIIFSQLFPNLRKYPNVKILLSSRPEDEILKSFNHTPDKKYIAELQLNTDDPNCCRDVKAFLKRRLTEIAEWHGLSSMGWPSDDDLEKLGDRASGLFIWAVTAANYINTQFRIRGKEILKIVLNQFEPKAMKEINTLYRIILDFSYPEQIDDPWVFETFRRLVGAIMVLREPLTIRDLGGLLDLREMPHRDPADVRNFVEHLRTLFVTNLDDITEDTIPQGHKSFFDFITGTGSHIPERFHVDIEASNAEMALLCLRQLTIAYPDVHDTHYTPKESDLLTLSGPILYSLRFGLSHMPQWNGTTCGVLSDHPGVNEPSELDALLHCSSHQNRGGPLNFSIPSNHAFVRTSFKKHSLIWNPRDGTTTTPVSILNGETSVLFSPDGSQIFLLSIGNLECFQRESYDLSKSSSTFALPHGWTNYASSFDGTKIAFGHGDGRVTLHSINPCVTLLELPKCYYGMVFRLAISRNESYIATVSKDNGFIHIWDMNQGHYINEPGSMPLKSSGKWTSRSRVCMAFSPDETLLITCNNQHTYIWEIPGCNLKYSFPFRIGGNRFSTPVAFSLDSQTVLAGSRDGTVALWNPHTGKQIGEPWKVPSNSDNRDVYHVVFRSCGNIALASCDGSVYVWHVHLGTLMMVIRDHEDYINAIFTPDGLQILYSGNTSGRLGLCNVVPLSLHSENTFKPKWTTFSPGGDLVISVATDEMLCWRLDAAKVVGNPLEGGSTNLLNAITYSADKSRIAGANENGTLYLWDGTSQKLLSSLPNCVHGVTALLFSPDGAQIMAKLTDDLAVVLTITDHDGIVSVSSDYKKMQIPWAKVEAALKTSFFDLHKPPVTFGTNPGTLNRCLKDVNWYPSRSDSVVWAYVNNHIVHAGNDGNFMVVPVGDMHK